MLQLARLVDRPDTGGKPNLTLQSLSSLVADDADLQLEVERLVQSACDACADVVDWRNRRIAHRDLPLALAASDRPLSDVTLADIDKALRIFATLLNHLEAHFNQGATTVYDWVQRGSADGLFYFLERGLAAERRDTEL